MGGLDYGCALTTISIKIYMRLMYNSLVVRWFAVSENYFWDVFFFFYKYANKPLNGNGNTFY